MFSFCYQSLLLTYCFRLLPWYVFTASSLPQSSQHLFLFYYYTLWLQNPLPSKSCLKTISRVLYVYCYKRKIRTKDFLHHKTFYQCSFTSSLSVNLLTIRLVLEQLAVLFSLELVAVEVAGCLVSALGSGGKTFGLFLQHWVLETQSAPMLLH